MRKVHSCSADSGAASSPPGFPTGRRHFLTSGAGLLEADAASVLLRQISHQASRSQHSLCTGDLGRGAGVPRGGSSCLARPPSGPRLGQTSLGVSREWLSPQEARVEEPWCPCGRITW